MKKNTRVGIIILGLVLMSAAQVSKARDDEDDEDFGRESQSEPCSITSTISWGVLTKECKVNGVRRWVIVKGKKSITIKIYDAKGKFVHAAHSWDELTDEDLQTYPELEDAFESVSVVEDFADPDNPKSRAYKLSILSAHDPHGAAIVEALKDKSIFDFFASGTEDIIKTLDTGVHESLHKVDTDVSPWTKHSYRLVNAQVLTVPSSGTFNRSEIFATLSPDEQKHSYATTYLTGASGQQGLYMLLEELNAYTHGAVTTMNLAKGLNEMGQINSGLQHMMYYLEKYLKVAREKRPSVYKFITGSKEYKAAMLALWNQAEDTLAQACESPNVTVEADLIQLVYSTSNRTEIEKALNIQVEAPEECGTLEDLGSLINALPQKERPSAQSHLVHGNRSKLS